MKLSYNRENSMSAMHFIVPRLISTSKNLGPDVYTIIHYTRDVKTVVYQNR